MITKTSGRNTFRKWMPLPLLTAILLMISCKVDKKEMSALKKNSQENLEFRNVPDQKSEANLAPQTAQLTLKTVYGKSKVFELNIKENNATKTFMLQVDGEDDDTTPQ